MADDLGAMKEPAPSQRRSEGDDRAPVDEPRPPASADGLTDRRSRDDQPPAAEPPAWRVLLAYARLVVGGLLSLATGAVGLALPLTAKRLVDDLAKDRSVTEALVLLATITVMALLDPLLLVVTVAVLGGAQVVTGSLRWFAAQVKSL